MTAAHTQPATQAISVTNFDLNSLYLLRPEIKTTLRVAEQHLTEFYDDIEQAPLLLDSVASFQQLTAVLELIDLSGASQLTKAIAQALQHLYEQGNNQNKPLILSLSQAVMILERYIEFVLLQETVEPSLLLPIINQLLQLIGQSTLAKNDLISDDFSQITLANPAQNFQSITELGLDQSLLATAYRSGLAVALSVKADVPNHTGQPQLTNDQLQKLDAMFQACHRVAQKSSSLFWQAAQAATKDLAKILPLNEAQKRLFIFLDQQFHNYLPADDQRFADLVSFACLQSNEWAVQLKQSLEHNQLDKAQLNQFAHFMYGPDQKIATQLNELLQQEISDIKVEVHALVNDGSQSEPVDVSFDDINHKLLALASTFDLLKLAPVANTLRQSAQQLSQWQQPSDQQLDSFLADLIQAENAAIRMSNAHTPGAQAWQLNNASISIHQLQSAYQDLTEQCRQLLRRLERSISDYLDPINPAHQANVLGAEETDGSQYPDELLHQIPQTLKQVAGAIRFLELTDAANILNHLALYLEDTFYQDGQTLIKRDAHSYAQFAKVADVLLAVDHQLSARQQQHPLGKHALHVGNSSLYQLLSLAA
ncbi:hypothetical protein [Psychrobacter sp. FDAARGOS_221]|uniref:hypothetical protein n=1 Tax=Psychrobacter sp. FDAARGOS_221 TaxID=1975705 RepID=UPI000BB58AA9|nr:hypothetical protein [Psychrobacter sp. FDAARGOS_221]PNK61644.1 hypothetical protein A6J60_012730 [Psychrobacter sp. FDAARGOS_221]